MLVIALRITQGYQAEHRPGSKSAPIADSVWNVNDEVGAAGWHRNAGSGVVSPRSVFRATLDCVMPSWAMAGVQVFAVAGGICHRCCAS